MKMALLNVYFVNCVTERTSPIQNFRVLLKFIQEYMAYNKVICMVCSWVFTIYIYYFKVTFFQRLYENELIVNQ